MGFNSGFKGLRNSVLSQVHDRGYHTKAWCAQSTCAV